VRKGPHQVPYRACHPTTNNSIALLELIVWSRPGTREWGQGLQKPLSRTCQETSFFRGVCLPRHPFAVLTIP
jgi:hypothetical protein